MPFATGQESVGPTTEVLILAKSVNTDMRPQRYDRRGVVSYYKYASKLAVTPIFESLRNGKLPGVNVRSYYWLNGSIHATVTPEGLYALAYHHAVSKIYKNKRTQRDPIVGEREGTPFRTTEQVRAEYDLSSIGIVKLFEEHPEIDGRGSVMGEIDSGVDGRHPALAGKILAFYNGQTKQTSEPIDFDAHGTHVAGTIVGGDRASNWIGVAPGAKLIVAGAALGYETLLEGMQWMIDIERNPQVATRVTAVSCSWHTQGAPDQEVFYRAIAAWEAAGILPVFSAGNTGRQGITHPHEYPGTFAVGAYGPNGQVAEFSSRGPGIYKGRQTAKPDISAPGVNINSTVPGGGYERMDGTSMATPHVTGTIALMLQINPKLNPAQIRELLVRNASPAPGKPSPQWDGDYGYGKLNAYATVKALLQMRTESVSPFMTEFDLFSNPMRVQELRAIRNASMGAVGEGADVWPETDESNWIKADDLYARAI